jgi:alkyl hydroperoxide reductase subunit AhpC
MADERPSLRLGSIAPNFEADTTQGRINFHDWIGDNWVVFFSHPEGLSPAPVACFSLLTRDC